MQSSPSFSFDMPQISAIIPARNEEENIEAAVKSIAAQDEIDEIIVVDDQSTDRTRDILSRLASEIPKLKILRAGELPPGWTGKNHALWIGAQAAKCDWLLFTDADTLHLRESASRALRDASENSAALVSYSPEQRTDTLAERAVIPFIYCRLGRRFDFARINNPALPDAAANGQFILVRRDAYEKSGGYEAIPGVVLEDVALARNVKHAGFRIYFASGKGIASTRMYRNFTALWQGWTKNLYGLLGGALAKAAREIALTFPWVFVVLLLCGVFAHGRGARGLLLALAAMALVLLHFRYARELKANRYPARFIIYYSVAAPLYTALVVASARKYRRGKVIWKGREYPVGGAPTQR